MTFKEYINNPTGAKTAVMSYRKMYEDLYHGKWNNLMVRENGKIDYTLYVNKKDYYVHLKIPSETVADFYYDVVIKFIRDNSERTLYNCPVQFFSNDPSFNFSFAHAFNKHKLTIPELESKMSKTALKKKAVSKNPDNVIGYVKTLYFAYIAMEEKGLFHVIKFEHESKPFSKKILLSNIEDTDTKINARTEEGKKSSKKSKDEDLTTREIKRPTSMFMPNKQSNIKVTGFVGSRVNKINKIHSIKSTKKSKRK